MRILSDPASGPTAIMFAAENVVIAFRAKDETIRQLLGALGEAEQRAGRKPLELVRK